MELYDKIIHRFNMLQKILENNNGNLSNNFKNNKLQQIAFLNILKIKILTYLMVII